MARAGAVSQPFFSGKGSGLSVNGENVQVFVYAGRGAAETEAKRVSPNGASVGTSMMSSTATPHYFRKGNLIVLYVGLDEAILRAIAAVLGPRFAGG